LSPSPFPDFFSKKLQWVPLLEEKKKQIDAKAPEEEGV